jgi:hypothetical protein
MHMADDNSTRNLLHFTAPTPLPTPVEPAVLADISTLEVAILATLWNYHPRPLRISEIYLGVRTAAGGKLEPCASAINNLAACGLVSDSGAPFFRYHLNHDGIFTALYLAIAGASNRFKIARVPGHAEIMHSSTLPANASSIAMADTATANAGQSDVAKASTTDLAITGLGRNAIANASTTGFATTDLGPNAMANSSTSTPVLRILPDPLARAPIVKPASEVEFEFCHTGCGRIATAHCECGNAVCFAHRYNADGQHDSAGHCSACYDQVLAERIGIQQCGEV